MMADHPLDNTRAINTFLKHFAGLSYLPFVTGEEMDRLYGEEVAAALLELDLWNRQEGICRNCLSRCCLLVNCELYDDGLSLCPVQSLRPPLCRMHFCHRFSLEYPLLVKSLGDIFLNGLLAACQVDGRITALFDCPPLKPAAPELTGSLILLIDRIKEGRLAESAARDLIQDKVRKAAC
jgi:hypothetical protein